MTTILAPALFALTIAGAAVGALAVDEAPNELSTPPVAVEEPTPSFPSAVPPALAAAFQDGGGDETWPPDGVPEDLDPIYWFDTDCPHLLTLVNWTECTLYFRTFLDCDGDGVADTMNEHFVMPADDKTGTPQLEFIVPKEGCEILHWGLFDILPWGDCFPVWEQDGEFPCAVHFY